ncbi:hypothetical protein IWQ48_000986 [Labrenzia sp. EL_13]|nr:hypothetical protein [Labrenzia sp. EL_142]MBG6199868.1 hypothetical protein [Labrenzia sp. EL_13]
MSFGHRAVLPDVLPPLAVLRSWLLNQFSRLSEQPAISSFHTVAPRFRISLAFVRGDGCKLKS